MPDRRPSCKRRRVSEVSATDAPAKLLNDSVAANHTNLTQSEDDMEFKEEIDLDEEEESNLYVDESVDSEGDQSSEHGSELLLASNKQVGGKQLPKDPGPSPNHKKCKECGIHMLKKNFARHMRDMHTAGPARPRSLCPLCQKSYKTADWLKDHIRRGHGYSKELTDQVMASLEPGCTISTNSESRMKSLSLEETKMPPLINLKEPTTSIAMIDIQSQPITILTTQTVVKEEKKTVQNI